MSIRISSVVGQTAADLNNVLIQVRKGSAPVWDENPIKLFE